MKFISLCGIISKNNHQLNRTHNCYEFCTEGNLFTSVASFPDVLKIWWGREAYYHQMSMIYKIFVLLASHRVQLKTDFSSNCHIHSSNHEKFLASSYQCKTEYFTESLPRGIAESSNHKQRNNDWMLRYDVNRRGPEQERESYTILPNVF